MNKNGQFAICKEVEYKCCFRSNGKVGLLSKVPAEGFIEFMGTYSKDVTKEECSRIYKKTLCFKYNNDSFLIREEEKDRVLLET